VAEWGGTLTTISEIPMDGEYTLELEQEDGRTGKIKLESVEKKQGKVTTFEYTFRGVTALG
jgi:major membrane immunogen (membrane-anchored lipoprotein)